ncbi:RHS repeat-associated core domain-containing protein [Elizabethkingia ursingii]|uniref:RHS repeat-associated core domain-containing protein n=1 Tax=Elizabethkingia ursingii TaxID=1756150 RepID=UPI002012685D|nr:RHS repeat-associated core domain-containing protein [Elizabethkingia ursingii]MCL1670506.1 FG-GAP-like repeat-containing protein [Elizabethkingia ursingii]
MKDLQKVALSNGVTNTNDINIDINWDELPDTPYGTLGNIPFHDTTGQIDVNGGGQLQYTLPIALPPGVKSVAPQINLVYTSGSGNGIAGYGWNISGVTAISRMGRTIEKDGEIKGIQLDYSDFYQFNGQRLILKSGEYGKDGAEYVTEKYSNIKIKSVGTNSGMNGPRYFEVTFEDGSQAWYGRTPAGNTEMEQYAATPVEYNIVKWIDAQGNYITYKYVQGDRVAILYSIEWGGNETAGTPHFNKIDFNYIRRDLREITYLNGDPYIQNYILSNVEVNANGSLFKKYSIEYKKDDKGNGYQFVKSITESNSKGETANPVTFEYQESKSGGWKMAWISNDTDTDVLHGDFDGDGKIDMLKYLDSFEECTAGYEEVYHEGDPYDPNNQYGYYEQVCKAQPEPREAGLYLFSSVFDGGKPKPIHTGSSGITKDQLKKAKAVNLKTLAGELLPRQGFVTYKTLYPQGLRDKKDLELKAFSIDPKSKQLKEEFTKVVSGTVYDNTIPRPNFNPGVNQYWVETYIEDGVEEIDLDGDGLSDLIFTLRDTYFWSEYLNGPNSLPTERSETRYRYLIVQLGETDPEKLASSLSIGPYYEDNFFKRSKRGDFNGDGIVDFLYFDAGGRPYLTTFKKNASGSFFADSTSYSNMVVEGLREHAVVGDFTGDGKTDLMVPQEEGKESWKLYISTGRGFEVQHIDNLARFNKNFEWHGDKHDRYINRQYFAQDLNKDGKADFIEFYSHVIDWAKSGKGANTKFIILYHENKGIDANGNIVFETKNIDGHWEKKVKSLFPYKQDWYPEQYGTIENNQSYDIYTEVQGYAFSNQRAHYSPVIGDFRINNYNEDILIFQKGTLVKYSHDKVSDEARIIAITQGGVTTKIDYKELDPNINEGFYEKVKENQHYSYPYIEMDKVSGSYAVSQLRQEGRKQDFKYRGLAVHLQGKGMIGFRQSARSSWYADGYENTKVWSGSEIDPLQEGLPVKEWSVRAIDDNNLIFPADISVGNTTLLSFKSTEYNIDVTTTGVKVIVPKKTITKDLLKDITEESNVIYGDYYLPTEIIKKVNNDFAVKSTVIEYFHNSGGLGKDYFIGRPKSKTETVAAYGDTKLVKEEYTYENNQVKTHKVYNRDNTGWVQDTFEYDMFGNIIQNTVSNSVDAMIRTEKSQYDAKGCFILKKTDNLGLETIVEYNDWGQVKVQKDPLGNTLNNTYDGWGKLLISKTNLGGIATFTYEKSSLSDTTIKEYAPDGNIKETLTNRQGQQLAVRTKVFGEQELYTVSSAGYDVLGRKTRESEPVLSGNLPTQWNKISYDDSVFPPIATATAFNGKVVKTTVSGRVTIVEELNGNMRITKETTDPLGNVISSEDKGGVVNFSFNAIGEQVAAQYGTNVVTTGYDVWGRKSEFYDPSNGLYKYEYNGLGQVKKEISPRGYKEYFYNDKGQLVNEIEKSNKSGLTDKSISINYNDKGLVTEKYGTSNGKNYASKVVYDLYGRVLESTENSNGRTYSKKDIVYDSKSRVSSYTHSLTSSGVTTTTQLENVYEVWSGQLYQVKDKISGKVLWKLQEVNAKGQRLSTRIGAVDITNTFDDNNFLTETQHNSSKGLLFGSQYSFDAIKNELKERTRQGNFAKNEVFTYDDNNRLIQWTNPKTGNISFNKYDLQGRITENDQVGTIQFGDTTKLYQPTGAKLNTTGKQNYLNAQIQRVIYNENNDPLYIQGKKGDVRFEYGLSGARQVVTFGAKATGAIDDLAVSSWEGTFTKYYSEDGSFEVVRNNTTGEEKHILYIGNTPYDSNLVYLKDFTQSSGSYKFLHKDYLGSILTISDEEGNLVQEAHFDAWGQLVAGSISLLDRGYTSHEHFEDVGIIHMNGRLYDPLLRRFLNADENIQDPNNTQNYNKYGYVLNNPLMYNDPNGEFLQVLFAIFQIISLVIAAVQLVSMIVLLATGNITFGQFLKFFLVQAVSALVSYGVGELFKAGGFAIKVLGETTAKLAKPLVHALSQGVLSVMRGESFVNGFGTALLASVAAGFGLNLGGTEKWSRALGATVSGAIGGGVGSVLTGGNFWQGAATGAIIGLFNDSMHDSKLSDPPTDFNGDVWFDKKGDSYIKKGEFLYDHYGANGKLIGSYISEVEVGKTYRDFRDMATGIQNAGDALTVLGYVLTLSIVGAEVGVPLVAVGGLISNIGSGIEISAHLANGKLGKAGESFAWMAAGEVVPKGAIKLLDPDVSKTARRIYKYGMSTKIILIQRAVNQ